MLGPNIGSVGSYQLGGFKKDVLDFFGFKKLAKVGESVTLWCFQRLLPSVVARAFVGHPLFLEFLYM